MKNFPGAKSQLSLSSQVSENISLYFTICMLGNFSCFSCHLLTFFKINFFKKILSRTTIRVSNSLDPDEDRHSDRLMSILVECQNGLDSQPRPRSDCI